MWNMLSYILFLWCLSTMNTCSTCSLGPWRLALKRFLMQGVPSQYPLARQMVIGKPQDGELGHALHMVCINHGVSMIHWDSLYTDYIWLSLPVSYISVSDYLIISDYIWLYLPQVRILESVELPAGWCHPDSSAHDAQSTWACTVLGHPTFETEYWHILTMQGAAVKDPKQHKQIKKRQAWQPWQQYYNSNYYNHFLSDLFIGIAVGRWINQVKLRLLLSQDAVGQPLDAAQDRPLAPSGFRHISEIKFCWFLLFSKSLILHIFLILQNSSYSSQQISVTYSDVQQEILLASQP